jgi:hypothetical protein
MNQSLPSREYGATIRRPSDLPQNLLAEVLSESRPGQVSKQSSIILELSEKFTRVSRTLGQTFDGSALPRTQLTIDVSCQQPSQAFR